MYIQRTRQPRKKPLISHAPQVSAGCTALSIGGVQSDKTKPTHATPDYATTQPSRILHPYGAPRPGIRWGGSLHPPPPFSLSIKQVNIFCIKEVLQSYPLIKGDGLQKGKQTTASYCRDQLPSSTTSSNSDLPTEELQQRERPARTIQPPPSIRRLLHPFLGYRMYTTKQTPALPTVIYHLATRGKKQVRLSRRKGRTALAGTVRCELPPDAKTPSTGRPVRELREGVGARSHCLLPDRRPKQSRRRQW